MNGESSVERPVHTGRKLYLVPLVYDLPDPPEGYAERVAAYWKEVGEHIGKLEARFGQVRKIYHESLSAGGEEGLRSVERINPPVHKLLDRKRRQGAELVAIEDGEVLQELLDWGRCLAVVRSPKVVRQVSTFYQEISQRRNQIMAERIDADLQDEEAALLLVSQDHALRFPTDVQVFYISPPALEAVRRLLREESARAKEDPERQSNGQE